jgi:cytochrome c biogenesis factor
MRNRRPGQVLLTLALAAVVCFGLSVVLDEHGNWGDPRQAATNILWIMFLLSTLAFVVLAVRLALVRRKQRV